jgi:hypothetical protein
MEKEWRSESPERVFDSNEGQVRKAKKIFFFHFFGGSEDHRSQVKLFGVSQGLIKTGWAT